MSQNVPFVAVGIVVFSLFVCLLLLLLRILDYMGNVCFRIVIERMWQSEYIYISESVRNINVLLSFHTLSSFSPLLTL